jgi:hypothetical protein
MPSSTFILNSSSRYQHTPLYFNSAGQRYWGLWERIEFPPRSDDRYYVIRKPDEGMRFDRLAFLFYQDFSLWWVICEANNILNPISEIYDSRSKAQSCVVFSDEKQPCFKIQAKDFGSRFNSSDESGIMVKVFSTKLEVYVKGVLKETFNNLSNYPRLSDGDTDGDFWGNIVSSYVTVNWLSPNVNRPSIFTTTPPAPTPPGGSVGKTYRLYGGKDFKMVSLRIPSLSHVHEKLSS